MIWDTENTYHRKTPTPYTTQIQNEALESEAQHLSYGQRDKGNPISFCKVLSDLEKTAKVPLSNKKYENTKPRLI